MDLLLYLFECLEENQIGCDILTAKLMHSVYISKYITREKYCIANLCVGNWL